MTDFESPSDSSFAPGLGAPRLSDADARVLDRLADVGFNLVALGELSAEDRARAERLLRQLALIDAYPDHVEAGDDGTLVAATMARIDEADAERAERMRLESHGTRGGVRRGVRFADFVAVACIVILAVTIVVPLLNWAGGRARETRCADNLRLVAQGLESYTRDYQSLPMAASLLPGVVDWATYRNSDNLRHLSATHYCGPDRMRCPGDKSETGSYAYQVGSASRRPLWNQGPRSVIVGDRNPLVDLERNGEVIASVALNSASHEGRGQNLLYSDASVAFTTSPYVTDPGTAWSQDNIWLPFGDGPNSLFDRNSGQTLDTFLLH